MKMILVVDDDHVIREILRAILETHGFEVLTAESAGDALEIAATRAVDAVITDYQMPRMDGLEFCRTLRDQNASLDRALPVWLMTGCHLLSTRDAIAAGAQAVFRKPFSAIEVCERIERHLGASTLQKSEAQR